MIQNKIAINYLISRFWIDLFATIPFDTIVELILSQTSNELQTFGILKLIRIARLNKIVTYMNVKEDVKIYLKLAKMFFFLSIYFHILGCLWFYMVSVQKKWIPPLDTIYPTTTFYQQDLWYQYWMSVYHAILIETSNDIAPRIETIQVVFWTLMILIGAVVNAYIFGMIIFLVAAMNNKSNAFIQKLDTWNNAMRNLKIPKEIQTDVIGYLIYTEGLLDSQNELETFLSLISSTLKEKVTKHIFTLTLNDADIFKGRNLLIEALTKALVIKTCKPEEVIMEQEDEPDNLYFIAKGGWNVYVRNKANLRTKANVLKAGDLFGEVSIISNCKRTATVKSNNYSTLAFLHISMFTVIFEKHPEALKNLKERRKLYQDDWKRFLVSNLKCIDYLKEATDDFLEDLYYELKDETFEGDRVIFKAGDDINKIYFVTDGQVEVTVKVNNVDIWIDTLYQGCSMGEYGVLGTSTFMFTATAKSNIVKVWYITKDIIKSKINASRFLKLEAERFSEPLKDSSDIFLDFRIVRTESRKAIIEKIIKLSVLRYMKIVKVFGIDFSFKSVNVSDDIKNRKSKTTAENTKKLYQNLIEKLNQIVSDNQVIKNTIVETESKINSIEGLVQKLEKLPKNI